MLKRLFFLVSVLVISMLAIMGAVKIWATVVPPPNDFGGWAYHEEWLGVQFGTVHVDCTHNDSKGVAWNSN